MKKIILSLMIALAATAGFDAAAQAKKPILMVIPGDTWCNENGFMTTMNVQGKTERVPDYEAAVQTNMDLVNVTTKVGELMADRGFPLKDMAQTIRSIKQSSAEDAMTTSRSTGATLAETPLDRLLNRAKSDIIVEVTWKISTMGPKKQLTYNLRGLDAYSLKQVAASQGTGRPSFSAAPEVLLEEAVVDHMDKFVEQLMAHFNDMAENGREVAIDIRLFDNGSGLSFEDEYNGEELTDIIDAWMAQNTVNHRYSMTDATDDIIRFEQVRIPLYNENGTPMDTRRFVTNLRKFLSKAPYSLTSKIVTKGLGRANLIIGEK